MKVTCNLFTYGTLMVPEVMYHVTGGQYLAKPVTLHGYARYRIRDRVYPGVIPEHGSCVEGILYAGIDRKTLRRIDEFESDDYQRGRIKVIDSDGNNLDAWCYIISPGKRFMLSGCDWNAEEFRTKHLQAYLRRIP